MKVVSWNCNGALRRKTHLLDRLDADLLIIQECEDPAQAPADYRAWAGEHVWTGRGKNRGIGLFARRGQNLRRLDWPDEGCKHFLPVKVDDLDVLAVWTQNAKPRRFSYVGQLWNYLHANRATLGPASLVAGDFNSSSIWDTHRPVWSHSDCVRLLGERGLRSLYHHATGEPQGKESRPTYFQARHETKPYHIDYIFVHDTLLGQGQATATVGRPADWLSASDHMPLIAEW